MHNFLPWIHKERIEEKENIINFNINRSGHHLDVYQEYLQYLYEDKFLLGYFGCENVVVSRIVKCR